MEFISAGFSRFPGPELDPILTIPNPLMMKMEIR